MNGSVYGIVSKGSGGGGGGGGIIQVTYAQLQALILGGTVKPGSLYKITDRGDLGLYFMGLSNTTLDFENGARDMLVPLTYQTGNFGGFDWLGIWNTGLTPSAGNVVIWGGHVWENVSGNLGAPVDDFSLDSEWSLVPKSIGAYKVKTLGCNYDFENDWISRAWDDRGNVAGCSYGLSLALGLTSNPVNHCDWGDMITVISNNNVLYFCNNVSPFIAGNNLGINYISGNTTGNVIVDNSNKGSIYNNSNAGQILNNSNGGRISDNSNAGKISNNSNIGDISSNENTGEISNNGNLGLISSNSNTGDIYSNSNGGDIFDNTSQVLDISYNFNTGFINLNSNTGEITNNGNLGDIDSNANTGNITTNSNNGNIENLTSVVLNVYNNTNNGNISTSNPGDIFDTLVNK